MKHYKIYKQKILSELQKSFKEEHTPNQTALSFAFGVFITSLPTLGTGLILFGLISKFSKKVNKIALFSSVLVLNPFIKPFFYIASINLGSLIITSRLEFTAEPGEILLYLITGNLIIAVLMASTAYFITYRLVTRYHDPVEELSEVIEEKVEDELEVV